ncbi:restriction endonuclease subunit S [Streptomyces sp. NBC_00184]|uniref:restriction endonuclease subunit S n=1 Tax=Streptomyces sp. NBC_00184 TaxID=2975673 RepID=UPI002E29A558|nr:restriction endonuclease subunit S [Streptomyces sp. NBC_00184]
MSEWKFVAYESLASTDRSAFSMGPFGSKITKDNYVPSGVPVIRGVNLSRGRFLDDDYVFITHEKADDVLPANVEPGDLIFTHRGTIGQVSMVPRHPRFDRYVIGSSQVKTRLDEKKALPEFYYYWFQSGEGQRSILAHTSTVGVPGISTPLTSIRNLQVPYPPLTEQQGIAASLGALDEKIAVNERIAAKTDALASSMFEALLASSEEINQVLLAEVADVNKSSVKPSGEGTLRYVDISSVEIGSYNWPEQTSWADAPGRARRKAAVGDTIWSTVRPNRRSHALVLDDDPDLVFSTGLAVLTPRSVGPAFLYEATRTAAFQAYLESVAEGSAYPAVRADRFKAAPLELPSPEERHRFEGRVMAIRLRAHQSNVESRTLATLRDTLLPQLMSGRLRVRDAEKIVEDHA